MSLLELPRLTAEQMTEVDRIMVEEYGILLIQMMENAGRHLAALTRTLVKNRLYGNRIVVLCGTGNNGGGGMVAARHLSNWGADVSVILAGQPDSLGTVPALQWAILERLPLDRRLCDGSNVPDLSGAKLIIDALIGYGLSGNPRRPAAELITAANESGRLVVSLDTPSGLDATTGIPGEPCAKADATMTLALPKMGLMTTEARDYVGELYVADIGVPPAAYSQIGLQVPSLFHDSGILQVPWPDELFGQEPGTLTRRRLPYSNNVKQVLEAAEAEAVQSKSKYIGSGHLLIGLTTKGTSRRVLASFGADYEQVKYQVDHKMRKYKRAKTILFSKPKYSPHAEQALELAADKASRGGSEQVRTQHLLSALMTYDNGMAARVLREMGVNPDDVERMLAS
jgi:NAD(P)H-hydrate epimerase